MRKESAECTASAVGWNWMNSMFAMTTPERKAIATPSPVAISGFVVRGKTRPQPPVLNIVVRARTAPTSPVAESRIMAPRQPFHRSAPAPAPAIRSIATWWSESSIRSSASQAATSARSISAPVRSFACAMRRWLCPPSMPRARRDRPASFVNSTPSAISSSIRAGPSSTMSRTVSSWHSPAPARIVSRTCASRLSVGSRTAAIPPCARLVLLSWCSFLVTTRTDPPRRATSIAKLSPAMPLPITRWSTSSIRGMRVAFVGIIVSPSRKPAQSQATESPQCVPPKSILFQR